MRSLSAWDRISTLVDQIDCSTVLAGVPIPEVASLAVDRRRQFVITRQSIRPEVLGYPSQLLPKDRCRWGELEANQWVCLLDAWLPDDMDESLGSDIESDCATYISDEGVVRCHLKLVIATKKYLSLYSDFDFSSPEQVLSDEALKCGMVVNVVLDLSDNMVCINSLGVMPAWQSKGLMSAVIVSLLKPIDACMPGASVQDIAIAASTAKILATSDEDLSDIQDEYQALQQLQHGGSGVAEGGALLAIRCLHDVVLYQSERQRRRFDWQFARRSCGLFDRPGALAPQYPIESLTEDMNTLAAMV